MKHLALGLTLLAGLVACGDDGATDEPQGEQDTTAAARWPGDELVFDGANLLLISIDTLRADRLGAYGYDRGTSPNLDAFAEQAVVFEDVYANSPKTASSHMSLFTSLYPTVHKVRNQSARLGLESPVLAGNRMTITQVLNRSDYWNAGVAGGANVHPKMGFDRGFRGRFGSGAADITTLTDAMGKRLDEFAAARVQPAGSDAPPKPGFFFLHTYQVHGPYLPPRPFMERFVRTPEPALEARVEALIDLPFQKQWSNMNPKPGKVSQFEPYWKDKETFGSDHAAYLSDLYDAEIAYTDEVLGAFLDDLDQRGLLDETLVVITSDHGEEFFEHGDFEHDQMYREHLHVPLMIRLPGGRLGGTRVSGLASLIDVMPTLLELLDVGHPNTFMPGAAELQGSSLVRSMETGRTRNQPVVAERVMFLPDGDYEASLRTDSSNVIWHRLHLTHSAYDLTSDPDEQADVACNAPFFEPARNALLGYLTGFIQLRDSYDAVDAGGTLAGPSAEQVRELETLGYTGLDAEDAAAALETLGAGDLQVGGWPEDCP